MPGRGADRMSSYGDWAALSDMCDRETALLLSREVSDGVIAPGYTEEALEILKRKRKGGYNVVRIDPAYRPAPVEQKDVYGVTFEQGRNEVAIGESALENLVTENTELPAQAKRDLILSLITLKYTQSNSVCYAKDGQVIGVGVTSRAVFTAPVWRATKRMCGIFASIPRCWDYTCGGNTPRRPRQHYRRVFPTNTRMCWRRAYGRRFLLLRGRSPYA